MPTERSAFNCNGAPAPAEPTLDSKRLEGEVLEAKSKMQDKLQGMPLYAWPLLILSVLMISSAAPTFATLLDVPALTLPAWRTQCTTLLLLVPGSLQFVRLTSDERSKVLHSLHWVLLAGLMLAVDFAFWIWGLKHTSLPHSLFINSSAPPVIAIGALIFRQPISHGELIGTTIAVVGAACLAFGGQNDGGATIFGDALNGIAVLAYVMYFVLGRRARGSVPIFTYMLIVTGSCAIFLSVGAVAFEGASIHRLDVHGLFGWMNTQYLAGIAWLATGPGIVGHTGMNALLKWMHPLQITLPQTVIPIVGSVLGWLIGVSALPTGVPTWVGGALLLSATVMVLTTAHKREARQRQQEQRGEVQLPEVQVVLSKQARGDAFWADDLSDSVTAQAGGAPAKPGAEHAAAQTRDEAAAGDEQAGPSSEILPAAQRNAIGTGRVLRLLGWLARHKRGADNEQGELQDVQEASALLSSAERAEHSATVSLPAQQQQRHHQHYQDLAEQHGC